MNQKLLLSSFLFFFSTFFPFQALSEEFRLGTTLSLTGAYSTYGRQAKQGIELAVEEANAAGGIGGKQIKLIVEDFGTLDLKRAVTAAQKLMFVDKVDLLLPLIIEDSEVIVPLSTRKPMFTMAVGCGARKCGSAVGPFHVRAPSSHDTIIERLVGYSVREQRKHSCVIAAESTYFAAYGEYIAELAKKAGQKVTYTTVPLSNSEDYREIATKFKHEKCDAVFAWIPMGSVGGFFRRLRENGSQAKIFSIVETDDPGVLKAAGDAAEGVIFARFSLGTPEFQAKYQKRFSEAPSRPAVPAYDGVRLLLELAAKVGTNPETLRAAILKVTDHPATNGVLTFTPEGERLGEAVELMRIEKGAPVPAQ